MPARARTRVLLVYAVPFSGHAQAAAALREALEKYPHAEIEEYHFLQQFKHTGAAIVGFYKFLLKYLPSVWGHVHNNPEYEGMAGLVISAMQEWDIAGLLKRVRLWQPDVIVAIQAFPLRILAEAKQAGKFTTPLVVVTTDFWAHRYWAHPSVDHYFVASDRAKRDLVRFRVPAKNISCTGIPLRSIFSAKKGMPLPSQQAARRRLGWPVTGTIALCLGGSYGLMAFSELIEALEKQAKTDKTRWVVVFGNNKKGLEEARQRLKGSKIRERVQLYGFQKDMHLLMRASDVCVTKAGGLSASEALVCQLPLIFYRPLPGQEQQNVTYLVTHGAAKRATSCAQVLRQVQLLVEDRQERSVMKKAQATLAHPKAAQVIATTILQRFVSEI